MKKFIFGILIICLLIGVPLMLMDSLSIEKKVFIIPSDYERIEINLSERARNYENVLSQDFKSPTLVELFIQSDSDVLKEIRAVSDHQIIGKNSSTYNLQVNKVTEQSNVTASYLVDAGKFTLSVTNPKAKGKMVVGYRLKPVSQSEFDRLSKIDHGDLNNPPDGYQEVYKADLDGKVIRDEVIYSLNIDRPQTIGLSIYTNSKNGNVKVDFIGNNSNYIGLVYSNFNKICDRLEIPVAKGQYQVRLTCDKPDGQLYVFIKK